MPVTLLLAKGAQVSRIAGDAIVMNVLVIRHILYLSCGADAKRARGTLVDKLYVDLLSR